MREQPLPAALSEAFDRTFAVLNDGPATYALIGGFAVAMHGLPRPTRDIDILFTTPRISLPGLLEKFRERGFSFDRDAVIRQLGMDHLSEVHYGEVRVDLLEAVIPIFRQAMERARDEDVHGHRVRVATPEDLVVLKLLAGREGDLGDVRGILAVQGNAFDIEVTRHRLLEVSDEETIHRFDRLVEDRNRRPER
jgi:predicted nucleotidyltransferase